MISLKNVSRIYTRKGSNENVVALDNVSLSFPQNGFISIVGASGSGKSTLLNVIGGIDKPTDGEMIVDDISTKDFKDKDWDSYRNEKIGFVLQNCYLLPHLSIKDNVAIKLQISSHHYQNISEMVDNALKEVDLYSRRNDRPKTLSGGQKQRVAIARAIVGKPTVILADEPTGALDSKNGRQIMELLKKLSEHHLVVMVTHNKEYAHQYSDRIIELEDGKVISDTSPLHLQSEIKEKKLPRVSVPFLTSLKWGIKNLVLRITSTLSIIIATSLGLAGVGLILSISQGVQQTFIETEAKALSEYPVRVSSSAKYEYDPSPARPQFPTEETIIADLGTFGSRDHKNYMSKRFLDYMADMPTETYTIQYKTSSLRMNLVTRVKDTTDQFTVVYSPSTYFYKGLDLEKFTKKNYDCIGGNYPTGEFDLAIVIDSYNRVDASILNFFGFNIDTSEKPEEDIKINFSDVIGKEFKYVSNNKIYYLDGDLYKQRNVYDTAVQQEIYNTSLTTLRISGILREKIDSDNPALNTGVIFSESFANYAVIEANSSDIVVAQKTAGKSRNVRTGAEIKGYKSGNYTYSADYEYENIIYNFGAVEEVTLLQYFTDTFANRSYIENYFNRYKNEMMDPEVDFVNLSYNDYLKNVSFQFDGAISLMTSVLYVFAFVSVFVSMVLNAILTYISVHQRTSEIGLLRSLGARKIDIGFMVETESIISGLLGSLLSIILCAVLVRPINVLLTEAIYRYKFYLLSSTKFTLPGFQWWVAPIMIAIGVATAAIAALFPAIVASKKDPARAINE